MAETAIEDEFDGMSECHFRRYLIVINLGISIQGARSLDGCVTHPGHDRVKPIITMP
jgi:hypothetical protein